MRSKSFPKPIKEILPRVLDEIAQAQTRHALRLIADVFPGTRLWHEGAWRPVVLAKMELT